MTKYLLSKDMVLEEYDKEWIDLITQAKQSGIRLEDVRAFLKQGNDQAKDKTS